MSTEYRIIKNSPTYIKWEEDDQIHITMKNLQYWSMLDQSINTFNNIRHLIKNPREIEYKTENKLKKV